MTRKTKDIFIKLSTYDVCIRVNKKDICKFQQKCYFGYNYCRKLHLENNYATNVLSICKI
jgi:hypothetical protein